MNPLSTIRNATQTKIQKIQELAVLSKRGKLDFWRFIKRDIQEEMEKKISERYNQFMVVVAGAGYGKTILLTQIAERLLKMPSYVPLFFRCDGITKEPIEKDMLLASGLRGFSLSDVIDQAEKQNLSLVILIDTLDALSRDKLNEIRNLAVLCSQRGVPLVGTCRPLEFSALQTIAESYQLKGFEGAEIKQILSRYEQSTKQPAPELDTKFLDLCRIPLHLRMFFEIYDPRRATPALNFIELFHLFHGKKVGDIREETLNRFQYRIIDKPRLCLAKFSVLSALTLELVNRYAWYLPRDEITYLLLESSAGIVKRLDPQELSFALHDLRDEGILSEPESDSMGFLNEPLFEYFIASYSLCPLLGISSISTRLQRLAQATSETEGGGFLGDMMDILSSGTYVALALNSLRFSVKGISRLFKRRYKPGSSYTLFAIIDRGREFKKVADSVPIAFLMERDRQRLSKFTLLLTKSRDPFHKVILRKYFEEMADKDPAELNRFFRG